MRAREEDVLVDHCDEAIAFADLDGGNVFPDARPFVGDPYNLTRGMAENGP
jgi:hypothetical protein